MRKDCLFCQIVGGKVLSPRIYEDENFIAINDKYPQAPIHVLVIPKQHVDKRKVEFERNDKFWGMMMETVGKVVSQLGLSDKGYILRLNGGGFNHFWHEHVHVLGGEGLEGEGTSRKIEGN